MEARRILRLLRIAQKLTNNLVSSPRLLGRVGSFFIIKVIFMRTHAYLIFDENGDLVDIANTYDEAVRLANQYIQCGVN
ncbi:MAG: hypothetical protein DRI26_00105 [Chloroflexi bacterium]|nr:MAG: hypothetical protein DRI26_00105 [Chloroflexota bacterium]